MSEYTEFYLNSKSSVVQLECIEITHSSFSEEYRRVRNAVHGVTVTHEDASDHEYTYLPMQLALSGPRDDLDHVLQIVLGDLGQIVPQETDNVYAAGTLQERPMVAYRTYASNNLAAPLFGPVVLEAVNVNSDWKGSTIEAKAPSLNVSRTGEIYSIARFPMLSGLR